MSFTLFLTFYARDAAARVSAADLERAAEILRSVRALGRLSVGRLARRLGGEGA